VKSAQWKGTIEMPRLRRLAIPAENPAKRAAFYQQVFELDRIGDHEEAIFLSDGSFNLLCFPREKAGREA
jgi:catechol-2,3-dioxygenase